MDDNRTPVFADRSPELSTKLVEQLLKRALASTSNLPKGMNRTAVVVAFMEAAAAIHVAGGANG